MVKRLIVSVIIIPLAILFIYLGGFAYQSLITLMLAVAAWEYVKLLRKIDLNPAVFLTLAGVILLSLSRSFFEFSYNPIS